MSQLENSYFKLIHHCYGVKRKNKKEHEIYVVVREFLMVLPSRGNI